MTPLYTYEKHSDQPIQHEVSLFSAQTHPLVNIHRPAPSDLYSIDRGLVNPMMLIYSYILPMITAYVLTHFNAIREISPIHYIPLHTK